MILSDKHITSLYAFTKKHFVEYYDLQTELVDHMANDIEVMVSENPVLTFEEARDKAFKKFGVFGFMEVVEQRQKTMNKKYIKLLWHYAKDWFRIPQVVVTMVVFLTFYTLFSLNISGYAYISCYTVLCLWLIAKMYKFSKVIKQKRKANEKIWLLEDVILTNGTLGSFVLAPQVFNIFNHVDVLEGYKPLLFASLYTFAIIYTYVTTVVLPKNAEYHLKETYPEYSL